MTQEIQDVSAATLVQETTEMERLLSASTILHLIRRDHPVNERSREALVHALGSEGMSLIAAFEQARSALTAALSQKVSGQRDRMRELLQAMLVAAKVPVERGWCTLKDVDKGTVRAQVIGIESAQFDKDGNAWGFLRISAREGCYENWMFTWRDTELVVRSTPDLL